MHNFKTFLLSEIPTITLDEDAAPTTATGGVANPDAKPMFKKSSFMGYPAIEVDEDTYVKCIQGKQPFKRWSKYVEDTDLRAEMKKMFQRNTRMLMVNARNGSMSFVK